MIGTAIAPAWRSAGEPLGPRRRDATSGEPLGPRRRPDATGAPPARRLRGAGRARAAALPAGPALFALLLVAIALGACGDPGKAAAGIVVAVDAPAGEVTGFTLRTQQGEAIAFVIGTLEVDGAAFAASHLVEHAVTLQPIAVAYRVEDGANVVHRMVDAPWAAPSS